MNLHKEKEERKETKRNEHTKMDGNWGKTQEQIDQERADEEYARRLQEKYDRQRNESYKRKKEPTKCHNDAFTSYIHMRGKESVGNHHGGIVYSSRNFYSHNSGDDYDNRFGGIRSQPGHVLDEDSYKRSFTQDYGRMIFYPTLSPQRRFPPGLEDREIRSLALQGSRDFDENDYETLLKLEDVKVGLDDAILRTFPCYEYKERRSPSPSTAGKHQVVPHEVISVDDDDNDDDDDDDGFSSSTGHKPISKRGKIDEYFNVHKKVEEKEEEEEEKEEEEEEGKGNKIVEVCPICLENIVSGELVRRLPCMDLYHKECIDQWLKENTKCPVCRLDCRQTFN